MKKVFLLLLILYSFLLFSQGENDNWFFGKNVAINFTNSTPTVLYTSQMGNVLNNYYVAEACGSISDANGNLLFYTNGLNIWNRNNQIMENGSGLLSHPSSEQLIIVKSLSKPNQYYVFTTGECSFFE
ncbi:MAG: cell surface protein, partial [Bacteroidetes bacterium]|nr:cell surface protein [Bacteroidota bacterium]